jgi:hypothetical protein
MPPILQTPITPTLRILLRLLLLRQMTFTVCHYAAHVGDIVLVVFRRVLGRVLLQDRDDSAAAVGRMGWVRILSGHIEV